MFILQRYKYYILNQKKSEKKFMELQKNERTGERMLFIVVPRLGIMRKSAIDAFQKQPPLIYAEQLHVED